MRVGSINTSASTRPWKSAFRSGFARSMILRTHATKASIKQLKSLFAGKAGVRSVLTPEEAAKDGWPTPAQSDQAPDLLLYAADGYDFTDGDTGEFQTPTQEIGAHGYPNTNPLMHGIFIAAGAGIQRKGEIPTFSNVDIGPTIAQLLHVSLGTTEGKPLTGILATKLRLAK